MEGWDRHTGTWSAAIVAVFVLAACSESQQPASAPATASAAQQASTSEPVVGLWPNPQERPLPGESLCDLTRDPERYTALAHQRFKETGVRGGTYAIPWWLVDQDENTTPSFSMARSYDDLAEVVFLSLAPVWSERLDTPGFLGADPFYPRPEGGENVAAVERTISRGKRIFDAFLAQRPKLAARTRWLSLGNEVDLFRARYDAQLARDVGFFRPNGSLTRSFAGYLRLVRELGDYARQRLPGIQITVSFNWQAYLAPHLRTAVHALTRVTDVAAVTYHTGPTDQQPRFREALPQLLRHVPGKLLLQEVGFMAAPGDEQQHVEFIEEIFDTWEDTGDRVPYLGLFSQYDWHFEEQPCVQGPWVQCDVCNSDCVPCGSGNVGQAHVVRWAGFLRSDGTAKPAWGRLKELVRERRTR